ncbi:hypothetical protein EDB83DRAFT_1513213 [Lactarius deliciosus]|nr:hypothetical protein EDB83DRAFT_1513213 [Lactarius deliciosus]
MLKPAAAILRPHRLVVVMAAVVFVTVVAVTVGLVDAPWWLRLSSPHHYCLHPAAVVVVACIVAGLVRRVKVVAWVSSCCKACRPCWGGVTVRLARSDSKASREAFARRSSAL